LLLSHAAESLEWIAVTAKVRWNSAESAVKDKAGNNRTHQTTGMWRSERRISPILERYRHVEEHTSHYSLFMCKPVGKTSGEVIAEIKYEALSAEHRLSYGTM